MVVAFAVTLMIGAAIGLAALRAENHALQQTYTVHTPAVANLENSAGQLLRLRLALATYSSLNDLHDANGADAVLKRSDKYLEISNDKLAKFLAVAVDSDDTVAHAADQVTEEPILGQRATLSGGAPGRPNRQGMRITASRHG